MSIFENAENLRLLQKLLNPEPIRDVDDSGSDDDDDNVAVQTTKRNNLNPANIGPAKAEPSNGQQPKANSKAAANVKSAPKTIEEWQAEQEKEDMELLESRKCPVYKISYRQAVAPEDVFLQMGNRTSASASCEDLVIMIELPEETVGVDKMDLTITETDVDLATPVYRLRLPLPQPVNVDRSRAEYETDERRLCLKLRMKREFDFINF